MEDLCSVCFQPGELYQVPGYAPTCIKCSSQIAVKYQQNFYTNTRPSAEQAAVVEPQQQHQQQHPQQHPQQQQQQQISQQQHQIAQQQQHQQQPLPISAQAQPQLQPQPQPPEHIQHQQQELQSQPQMTALSQQHQNSSVGTPRETAATIILPENHNTPASVRLMRYMALIADQNSSPKKMEHIAFDLEQTLQNMDKETLYGDEGTCPICHKMFTRKASLLNHIRNHSAEKKFVCAYCQKGFTQAANLRNHERIHTNERPYVCIDCGKAFTQVTNLNNHRRLHTGERPFCCIESDCGRSFAQVTNLNNHMKTHHKIQQYVCNQCPRRFTQVTQLNHHLATHSGLKAFFCPHCPDKSFKLQSQLQQHMKIHGLEFPFACTKCDEKFIQPMHLNQHMKVHEESRFNCNMCASSFNEEVLLKKHIQRHLDGRYLTCPIPGCNEGFTIKHHLSKHLQQVHSAHGGLPKRLSVKRANNSMGGGKHNCYFESCDQSFNNADELNAHLRIIHGLSILKNAGKKTKMDIMLSEQLKNATGNQHDFMDKLHNGLGSMNASTTAAAAIMNADFLNNPLAFANHPMIKQEIESAQLNAKKILSVQDIMDLSDDARSKKHELNIEMQKILQAGFGHQLFNDPKDNSHHHNQRTNNILDNLNQLNNHSNATTGAGTAQTTSSNISNSFKLVCNFCFNVFKSPQSLARHIDKFHC